MKPRELMIGDWVRGTIDRDEIWQWEEEDYLNIEEENIEPIHLTNAILEANE